ncbi:interleukin-1 beta [Sinocyclocheilus anshuiensis]|uniref:Interleukin-1 n=1 Tax=Sinocyclocheilus anshuiensis TaxID=1608454 RepID=A0A671LTS1_9TELE|nr:PREDICTED: interleukin-1 beta-like [Sinocyclocheilus anshuiensis]
MAYHGYDYIFDSADAFKTDSAIYSDSADSDELDCPDQVMSCQCDMHEDIKVELSPHPHSMRQVVNIIIAVERLKHIKGMSSGKFCEDALLNFILENVIEERLVKPLNVTPTYCKTSRTLQCTVCDKYKKTLVQSNKLGSEPLHLKAVTLSAAAIQYKVRFSMSTYVSSAPQKDAQPVCLGISNSNLYLACTQSDGSSPDLLLKEVSGPLNTIKAGDPNGYDSLLFFRKETGTAYNSFESVKYPGWFITTAFDDWEKVEMYQVPTNRTTNFTLEDQQLLPR